MPYGHAARANMPKAKQKPSNQPAEASEPAAKKPRRTSGALRKSLLDRGAHLIRFDPPNKLLDPLQLCPDREHYKLSEYPRLQPGSTEWTKAYDQLANALRKGVFVTQQGCIMPHRRWCTKGDGIGSGQKGYQLVGTVVYGFAPDGQPPAAVTLPPGWSVAKSEGKAAEDNRKLRLLNALGWDSTLEASHLCHNNKCMHPLHLVYEPAWRNRKRNYCGAQGQCDCGQKPPCLQPYTPSERDWDDFQHLNVERSSLPQLLFQPLQALGLNFRLEQLAWLQQRDEAADKRNQTRENKKQREAAGKSQAFKAAKKAARRVSNQLAKAECNRAGLSAPSDHELIADAAEAAMLKHLSQDSLRVGSDE